MASQAFIHIAGSYDPNHGGSGGWVVACGDSLVYGNAFWPRHQGASEADRAAALTGISAALDAFPDISELLISADSHEVESLPWGVAAEGFGQHGYPGELLTLLRERGVRHAVRWYPREDPAVDAAGTMMHAATALAALALKGADLGGRLNFKQGWRGALVSVIGHTAMDLTLRVDGLDRRDVGRVSGLTGREIDALLDAGRLRTTPEGYVTYASALEARDGAGAVRDDVEELGRSHLDGTGEAAFTTIFLDMQVTDGMVGYGFARAKTHGIRVVGQVARVKNVVDLHKDAIAVVIDQIRQRISELNETGHVDLVTPNNWLSRLLGGLLPPPTERIGKALEDLDGKLFERGLVLRPHFLRENLAVRGRGTPAFDMMMAAVLAARISATGTHFAEAVEKEVDATGILLSRAEEAAAKVRLSYFIGRQGYVAKELFRNAPGEEEAKARFKALAMDTHATYVGRRVALQPFLPGPFDGGIGMLDESGARSLQKSYILDEGIERRWVDWWREYAEILSRHPVLALREALLRLDGEMRTAAWPRIKHEMAVAWSRGRNENCPFRLRGITEAHLIKLVRDCGGWPFPPPPETVPYGNGRKATASAESVR